MAAIPRVAYDIQTIHDCVVRDTAIAKKFSTEQKKRRLYHSRQRLLRGKPAVEKMIDRQYVAALDPERGALLGKVGWLPTELVITDDAISEIARSAELVNEQTENIGARRLHTIMERVIEEISFDAPARSGSTITIDADYVKDQLREILKDQDLSRYIL